MPDRNPGWANLHLHSIYSDGELPPAQLVEAHAVAGFAAIALTDHDTLAGLDALGSLKGSQVRVIPGVELSIEDDPLRGLVEVHVLGYGFDPQQAALRARLEEASAAREGQKRETVRRLRAVGYAITWEEVRVRAQGNVGKPHIVAALEARNPDVRREDLYALMGPGGPAHVPRAKDLSLQEAVTLIRNAGGVSVLAHPGVYRHVRDLSTTFQTCAAAGIRGLEVTYPQDSQDPYGPGSRALMDRFAAVARSYGWVATGGDDYHGPSVTPQIRLAEWRATPASCVAELLARRG